MCESQEDVRGTKYEVRFTSSRALRESCEANAKPNFEATSGVGYEAAVLCDAISPAMH